MKKEKRKLSLQRSTVALLNEAQRQQLQHDAPAQQKCSGEDCFSRISCWPTKPV